MRATNVSLSADSFSKVSDRSFRSVSHRAIFSRQDVITEDRPSCDGNRGIGWVCEGQEGVQAECDENGRRSLLPMFLVGLNAAKTPIKNVSQATAEMILGIQPE